MCPSFIFFFRRYIYSHVVVDPSKDIDSRRDPTIPSNFSLLVLCRAPSIDLIGLKINAEFEYNSTYQFKEKRNEHNEIFLITIISNI